MKGPLIGIFFGLSFYCINPVQIAGELGSRAESEVDKITPDGWPSRNMSMSNSVDWSPFNGGGLSYDEILRIAKKKVEHENPGYFVIDPVVLTLHRTINKEKDGAGSVFGPYCWKFECVMLSKHSDEVSITAEISLLPDGSEINKWALPGF